MGWRHHEPWQTGTACIITDEAAIDCPFEIGCITTGKQRVFHRYYIRVDLPDGSEITGEDEHNVRTALFALDRELQNRGLALLAVGLDERWGESGLSHNSGYGYLSKFPRAVHMMELPPLRDRDPENDRFVDGLIREAVDGMFRGSSKSRPSDTPF